MLHRHHIPMLHGHHTNATRTPCPVLKHWNHTNPIIKNVSQIILKQGRHKYKTII